MHHRIHNHHNHHIKIVPFNKADNDETIPNTLYRVIYVHTNCQFEEIVKLSTHVRFFCHLNMFFWHNDIEKVCV